MVDAMEQRTAPVTGGLHRSPGRRRPRGRGRGLDPTTLKDRVLELDSRRAVFELVTRVPGIHLRRILRELELPLGTVEYQLYQLQRFGLIESQQEGRKKAYFERGALDVNDARYLYYMRHRTTRWVVQELLEQGEQTPGDLARSIHRRLPTVSYHLNKLARGGLVESVWAGRTKYYRLIEPERARRLVERFSPTFRVPTPRHAAAEAVANASFGSADASEPAAPPEPAQGH